MNQIEKEIIPQKTTVWKTNAIVGEAMEMISDDLEELAGEDQKMIVPLLFEEVFVNVANYAYPKNVLTKASEFTYPIQIECISFGNRIFSMVFTDDGIEFDPTKFDPGTPDSNQIGGHGIRMMKELSKGIYYTRLENKNVFTILF